MGGLEGLVWGFIHLCPKVGACAVGCSMSANSPISYNWCLVSCLLCGVYDLMVGPAQVCGGVGVRDVVWLVRVSVPLLKSVAAAHLVPTTLAEASVYVVGRVIFFLR